MDPQKESVFTLLRSRAIWSDPWLAVCAALYIALGAGGAPLALVLALHRHYLLAWLAVAVPLSLLVELGKGLYLRFECWQRRPRRLDRERLKRLSDAELLESRELVQMAASRPLKGPLDLRLCPHYSEELYHANDRRLEELRLTGLLIRRDGPERWDAGEGALEALDWERERRDLKLVAFKAPGRASRPSGLAERLAL